MEHTLSNQAPAPTTAALQTLWDWDPSIEIVVHAWAVEHHCPAIHNLVCLAYQTCVPGADRPGYLDKLLQPVAERSPLCPGTRAQ
jgi:hypothetical protein